MTECVHKGCTGTEKVLPGTLRSPKLLADLAATDDDAHPTRALGGSTCNALAFWRRTPAVVGILFKEIASISGAEVGRQGEVGSACARAAGGLFEAVGGSPEQVGRAAGVGIEHYLGLTCDPVGRLVQIPRIERIAMASNKAVNAARIALRGDGSHKVSLD